MMKILLSLVVAALPLAAGYCDAVKLTGGNTKVTFVGTKPGGKHNGGFKVVSGTATVEAGKLTAVEAEFDAGSLYTDTPMLTNHLKSPDFFDVKQHPKATFKSTGVEAGSGSEA